MDRITNAITLLGAVLSTMDSISVVGVDNQSKFVGCAEAVQNVSQTLADYLAEAQTEEAKAPTVLQESGIAKGLINKEESDNG